MKSAFGRINPLAWMKSLRDEIRLRRVIVADFIQPEIYLGLHPNLVWTSSSLDEDFITEGDFIFTCPAIYF